MSTRDEELAVFSYRHPTTHAAPGTPQRALMAAVPLLGARPHEHHYCGLPEAFVVPDLYEQSSEIADTAMRLDRIEKAVREQAADLSATRRDVATLTRAVEDLKKTIATTPDGAVGRGEYMLDRLIQRLSKVAGGIDLDLETEAELFAPDE